MRLILFLFLLNIFCVRSQLYLFNGLPDSTFYFNVCNSFFVNEGIPMSMDGMFLITRTQDPKVYAVTLNQQKDTPESIIYIVKFLENPETQEQEKVVIDKFPIKIVKENPVDSLCLVNLSTNSNSDDIELKWCGDFNRGLVIVEYDISFLNQVYSVKSSQLTKEIKNKLYNLAKGQEIKTRIVSKDLLNKYSVHKQSWIK